MLYSFRDTATGEINEYEMPLKEYDQFIIDHPELEQVIVKAPSIGDAMKLGVLRPPQDFQEGVLGRMRASIPKNNIKSKYWKDYN